MSKSADKSIAVYRKGLFLCVLAFGLAAPAHGDPAQTDLWTTTLPLPELLFDKISPCARASDNYPVWKESIDQRFIHQSIVATRELLVGLCLEGAGVKNEATHAFLKARAAYIEGIDILISDAQRREKTLRDRQDLVKGLSLGFSALLGMSAKTTAQAQQVQGTQALIRAITDSELQQINEGIRALARERPAELTRTIRIPVVPAAGFLKHVVRVKNRWGSCTGSFVGPRIVLTNLHCIGPDLAVVRDMVVASESYSVKTWWTSRGERGTLTQQEAAPGNFASYAEDDWALIELNESRSDADDYLAVAPVTPATASVMVAGYSGDVSDGAYMTLDLNCPAKTDASRVTFQCSTYKGSSGSPVLSMFDQRVVVALNNGMGRRNDTANTRGLSLAVRVERFAPKLYELLGSRPPAWASDEHGSRRLLSHAKQMHEQRSKPLELPKWND